ncbi:hypothetical protein [Paraburkholderia sediminicola]|uniref:hypothetical protein n=1 Tax=Paraburkholderia sediminicola TaxID=458836 RepID=UPI0038BA8F10
MQKTDALAGAGESQGVIFPALPSRFVPPYSLSIVIHLGERALINLDVDLLERLGNAYFDWNMNYTNDA